MLGYVKHRLFFMHEEEMVPTYDDGYMHASEFFDGFRHLSNRNVGNRTYNNPIVKMASLEG